MPTGYTGRSARSCTFLQPATERPGVAAGGDSERANEAAVEVSLVDKASRESHVARGLARFEQASRERDTMRELKAMGWRAEGGAKQTQHAEPRRTRGGGDLIEADVVREMREQVVAATTQRRITTGARTRHRLADRGCSARRAEHGRQVLVQERLHRETRRAWVCAAPMQRGELIDEPRVCEARLGEREPGRDEIEIAQMVLDGRCLDDDHARP